MKNVLLSIVKGSLKFIGSVIKTGLNIILIGILILGIFQMCINEFSDEKRGFESFKPAENYNLNTDNIQAEQQPVEQVPNEEPVQEVFPFSVPMEEVLPYSVSGCLFDPNICGIYSDDINFLVISFDGSRYILDVYTDSEYRISDTYILKYFGDDGHTVFVPEYEDDMNIDLEFRYNNVIYVTVYNIELGTGYGYYSNDCCMHKINHIPKCLQGQI